VTPTAAIYESIFPGVNLYRVPSILRDVVTRLEPNGRGEALIAATWLALVGGALAPRVLRLATTFAIGDIPELARTFVVVSQLGLGLTVAGGALLIVLIGWIERRMAARARDVPAPAKEAVIGEPAAPTRAQTIGEAVGVSAANAPSEPVAGEWDSAEAEPPREPARPRWGGAVATPGHAAAPTTSPAPPPPSPAPSTPPPAARTAGTAETESTWAATMASRYGDNPDDWPIGEDES
jgi:hypothetical protein